MQKLNDIVDLDTYPIENTAFGERCLNILKSEGVLTLPGFLRENVIEKLVEEAELQKQNAYFTTSTHNVYLTPKRSDLEAEHVFNRQLCSSKGCITTDQVPPGSYLHTVYNAEIFRQFIAAVVGENKLYEYADPLSSINVHFASEGQELNWHFDNSEFAITLLLQSPKAGGRFEYVKD
ncbi:MAG: 2OG-Fe(II) oxygenase, partial [Marinovum sp.]|nr:2OG-Fe(II) oxygenase [Marinovum sp.]